jgi:signal transduction histidine kinase
LKLDIPVPHERLAWFRKRLGLNNEELKEIGRNRELFLPRKEEFAERLFTYFHEIPETRAILDHEKRSEGLKKIWAHWYTLIFRGSFDDEVLSSLWRSGLRHVEINLDKRFINLSYAFARQFFHEVARGAAPRNPALLAALDKVVDFCLLIETHAYVTATSQCDMEVVRGMSHQVRNPLTVIGGSIVRLQRDVEPGSAAERTYKTILMENRRLEHLVKDAVEYTELLQAEPVLRVVPLQGILLNALRRVEEMPEAKIARIEMSLDPESPDVQGDATALETMFDHLLRNSLEAVDPASPLVRISSGVSLADRGFVRVEIYNTGRWPTPRELENVFVPFYSTKPYGTGFGLPIARIVARKSLGDVALEPLPGEGTRCIVMLQIPGR